MSSDFVRRGGRIARGLPAAGLAAMLAVAAPPAARGDYPGTGAVGALSELSPAAVSFIQGRSGTVGVAVYNNKNGKHYTYNGGWKARTASCFKVGIMAALLDRVQREGRGLTDWEKSQLTPMITQSDNAAATTLWNYVGQDNVLNYLRSLGMTSLTRDPEVPSAWGYTWANSDDFLKLVSKVRYGKLWSADKHAYALSLMKSVIPSQAFLRAGLPAGTDEAEKCGWTNSDTAADNGAWRVHSIGAVTAGGSSYTIAIMSRYPVGLGLGYGTATIAGVVSRIHASFLAYPAGGGAVGGPVRINTGPLNVRSGPGTGYGILGTVPAGQIYIASNSSAGWWKIWYDQRTGWISGGYVSRLSGESSIVVNTDLLNVRTGPGTGYPVAGTVTRGEEFYWPRYTGLNGYYQIYWRGGLYYVSGSYVFRKSY